MKKTVPLLMLVPLLGSALFIRPGSAAPKPTYLYVHDDARPNRLFGFRLLPGGKLSPLAGFPIAAGGVGEGYQGVSTLAYSRLKKLLFVEEIGGILVYQVNADGSLTEVAGSPFGPEDISAVATVGLNGRTFVYGSDTGSHVYGFEVQPDNTLAAVPGSPFPAGSFTVAVAAARKVVVAANEGDSTLSAYVIQADGSLKAFSGSPIAVTGALVSSVAVTPNGGAAYVPDVSKQRIFEFKTPAATGKLKPFKASPRPIAVPELQELVVSPNSTLRVVAIGIPSSPGNPDLQLLHRSAAGALGTGPTAVSGLKDMDGGAFNGSGTLLVVTSGESDALKVFSVKSNGLLAQTDKQTLANTTLLNGVVFARP